MNKQRILQALENVKSNPYGKWGILNIEQRRFIKELCDSWLILDDATNKQMEEIERLNNIINELEKWCLSWKENDKYCYLASNDKDKCRYDIWEEVLDKLQELKGNDKE